MDRDRVRQEDKKREKKRKRKKQKKGKRKENFDKVLLGAGSGGEAMRQRIISHFDLCTGCTICQLACSTSKTGGTNPRLALLRIKLTSDGLVNEPVVCQQCANPFCLRVCPRKAIARQEETGAVVIDQELCNGCGLCARYCHLGVILIRDRKAVKCDLCGGEPECVKYCPAGALELMETGGEQ